MFIDKIRSWGERGDTIVEVMIAVAIVSMVLGGAYVSTNNNIQTSRNTEEQGSALKLAESQVEQLKGIVSVDPAKIFDSPYSNFCIYQDVLYDSGNANCTVDFRGSQGTNQPQYQLSVNRSNSTFTVNVRWDKLGGGQSNVRMVYRIHE